MRLLYSLLIVFVSANVTNTNAFAAETGYFSGIISAVQQSTEKAVQAATLEDLHAHARHTMVIADAFQKEAQAVNDYNYANEAVEIYNSAYRATQTASLNEGLLYARQAASSAGVVADQSSLSLHDPYARAENDPTDRYGYNTEWERMYFGDYGSQIEYGDYGASVAYGDYGEGH